MKTPTAIESWVLRVVDQASRTQHCEDSLVELKRDWPSPQTAARILAGHANAAHGAHILWIIGVDEQLGVVGAPATELSNWFSAVRSFFDAVAPSLRDLNVTVGDRTVVALLFETDRAPYMVRNPAFGSPGGGPVEREVPWREGRKTITSRREHLIRMLAPITELPDVECMDASASAVVDGLPDEPPVHRWKVRSAIYLYPTTDRQLVLPRHKVVVKLSQSAERYLSVGNIDRLGPNVTFGLPGRGIPSRIDSETISATSTEALIAGPGQLLVEASCTAPFDSLDASAPAQVSISLSFIGCATPLVLETELMPEPASRRELKTWRWSPSAA